MKKVAIVGLGWLGMPLAMSLAARGWQVTGSKTTLDGVEAARMSGIESYSLRLEPELVCETDDLDALMDADALVITLPARRSGPGETFYLQAMQQLVDSALAYRIPRIIFTSSTSVYGDAQGIVKEGTPRNPVTASGRVLKELEDWWIFCAWPDLSAREDIPVVFSLARQRQMDTMASIWCIWMMWFPPSLCCCKHQKGDTSIIYVRLCIRRAMCSIHRWPASWGWSRRNFVVMRITVKVKSLMATVFVTSLGLSTSILTRW